MNVKKQKTIKRRRRAAMYAILIVFAIFIYFWNVLGERGLRADATRTSGFITPFEVVLLITAVVLIVAALVLWLSTGGEE